MVTSDGRLEEMDKQKEYTTATAIFTSLIEGDMEGRASIGSSRRSLGQQLNH